MIDLNEFPSETMSDEFDTHGEENDDQASGFLFEPFVGQTFSSEQEACKFYENFAKRNGFSIRKGRFTKNKNTGEVNRRDFFCHREGFPDKKVVDPHKNQRNRESSRCGCQASMRIILKKTFEIFPEEWHITQFVKQHNHGLLPQEQVKFLPSYRTISKEDEQQILLYKKGGLSVRQIMRVMELEKNIKHGDLPFLRMDIHNFLSKDRQKNGQSDVMSFLRHCKLAKDENPSFQYDYTVDGQNQLEHIFWSPAHCFEWYQKYGDAVAFDTTYKVNYYDMPFGIFVGIDNYGRTILFGCALLRNETVDTFQWLMKVIHMLTLSFLYYLHICLHIIKTCLC